MQPAETAHSGHLRAGAATADITPLGSVFLFGYPHVPRMSTGVHDRLECAGLFLQHGSDRGLFLTCDLIFVAKELVDKVCARIQAITGLPADAITISATHTHSGPAIVDYLSNEADPVVPKADREYLDWLAEKMVEVACAAIAVAAPADAGLSVARASGVGTNRHDPAGPADPDVPVLVVRSIEDLRPIACMVVYAMHPTVLHEDSTLVSADFPYFTRRHLIEMGVLPASCAILYHNGASGDQSPRHVTRRNDFAEAERIGVKLGRAIAEVIPDIRFKEGLPVKWRSARLALKVRDLPSVTEAESDVQRSLARLQLLRRKGAERVEIRSAECDWFGSEETLVLSRAVADGRIDQAVQRCLPAQIQVISIGPWNFVAWPGELFVEYALAVKARRPDTFVITMANGELQGYIATPIAVAKRYYEASNALFCHTNGTRIVTATVALLESDR